MLLFFQLTVPVFPRLACAQTVMNITRTVFGKHRAGYLFPLLLCVKPMAGAFTGIIQQLHSKDEFILFTSVTKRIVGATREALRFLGNVELEDNIVPLSRLMSDLTYQQLLRATEQGSGKQFRAGKPTTVRAMCAHPELKLVPIPLLNRGRAIHASAGPLFKRKRRVPCEHRSRGERASGSVHFSCRNAANHELSRQRQKV